MKTLYENKAVHAFVQIDFFKKILSLLFFF